MRRWKCIVLLTVILLIGTSMLLTAGEKKDGKGAEQEVVREGDISGQTVTLLIFQGPQVALPALKFGKDWEAKTGAKLNIIEAPYGDLYTKTTTAFATGTAAYDVMSCNPSWIGDWIPQGFLDPVPQWALDEFEMDDVLPPYRDIMLGWGGTQYLAPYDGDTHIMYYRKDVINPDSEYNADFKAEYGYDLDEPETWDQYFDIMEFFKGKDWNKDGKVDYGCAASMVRGAETFYFFFTRAGAYAKHPDSPFFFFDENMDARVNNPGFLAAAENFKKEVDYGPPGMLGWGIGEIREAFIGAANVLFITEWGDTGTLVFDETQSNVAGKVGSVLAPAAEKVWNDAANSWDKGLNYGPFMAYGGNSLLVAADSDVKEAAWDFVAYLCNPEQTLINCVTPNSGINPNRFSVLESIDPWVESGMTKEFAMDYLGAIGDTLDHPNVIVDMRIPGSAEYQVAIDRELSRMLAGELSPKEALDNAAASWNDITDRLGRETQIKFYHDSLGIE